MLLLVDLDQKEHQLMQEVQNNILQERLSLSSVLLERLNYKCARCSQKYNLNLFHIALYHMTAYKLHLLEILAFHSTYLYLLMIHWSVIQHWPGSRRTV